MSSLAANPRTRRQAVASLAKAGEGCSEASPKRYPISRWYIQPAAGRFVARLAATRIRPAHLTWLGLILAAAAAAVLVCRPSLSLWAAGLVLAAWFCDRADGMLARRQQTGSAWGAWLDGNVDELVDVGLHIAVGAAAASQWAWLLLVGFLAGKYLFLHGLASEREAGIHSAALDGGHGPSPGPPGHPWLHGIYHLPGNADVRLHLLIVALAGGWFTAELALIACYYNVRWIARYWLVARRLGDEP